MTKKILFFDGDGTLWYPRATKRTVKPFWIYQNDETKDACLEHLIITPHAVETLRALRQRGLMTVILSTHPHEPEEAAAILDAKVRHFKLSGLFDEIHATAEYPEAKAEKIVEIVRRYGLSVQDALMIGDSYRWDYAPARTSGIDAVLVNSDYHQAKLATEPVEQIINELDGLLPLVGLNAVSRPSQPAHRRTRSRSIRPPQLQ